MAKVYGVLPEGGSPPSAPIALFVETVTASTIELFCDSVDSATGYTIYVDGVPSGPSSTPFFLITGLSPSTSYSFQVQASNSSGSSALSSALVVSTLANSPPVWAVGAQTGVLGQAYVLELNSVCSDTDGQTLVYSILANTVPGIGLAANGHQLTGAPTAVGGGSITVDAFDGYAHVSQAISFTVSDPDVTAPTVPSNVLTTVNGSNTTTTWNASTDASGILRYRVFRNGTFRAPATILSYAESGVPSGTYTYSVSAVDNSTNLNESAQGSAPPVVVLPASPDAPRLFVATAVSSTRINLSWAAGLSGAPPDDYDADWSLTGTGGWTALTPLSGPAALSFSHTGLTPGTLYFYRVRALTAGVPSGYTTTSRATLDSGTTRTIPTSTSDYDASVANPGDTIVISRGSTGTRGPLKIRNCISTGTRIRVVGDPAGLVTIRKTTPGGSGFIFQLINCHGVDFDFENTSVSGAGAANHCGVKIMYASGAGNGVGNNPPKDACTSFCKFNATNATNITDDITIRYLWIDGGWNQNSNLSLLTNGIGIQANHSVSTLGNGHFQDGLLFEYCLIENVVGEGMYIGTNWKATGNENPLRNIEVSHVTIRNTGQDGFNGKKWWEGTNSVHDCVITDCGFTQNGQGPLAGISMLGSTATLYNNRIDRSGGPGAHFSMQNGPLRATAVPTYGTYASFNCTAYNNEITNSGQVATESGDGLRTNNSNNTLTQINPFFYNNSITGGANGSANGIKIGNSGEGGGRIQNNICLDNSGTEIVVGPASTVEGGNLTSGITAAACFTNVNTNLHLTAAGEAAALGCTGTKGTNYSSTDKDGASRSATPANAHKGAYET